MRQLLAQAPVKLKYKQVYKVKVTTQYNPLVASYLNYRLEIKKLLNTIILINYHVLEVIKLLNRLTNFSFSYVEYTLF